MFSILSKSKKLLLRFLRIIFSYILKYSKSLKLNELLIWPVYSRLFSHGYTEIVEIYPGILMKVYGDMEDMVNKVLMFTSKYVKLAWEPGTARLVERIAKHSKCSVVAGSHIGYYPLILSKLNNLSKVYAFEPNPINFDRLVENIKLNNFINISAENIALGNEIGNKKMYFDFGQSSFVNSSRKHKGEGIVSICTVDIFFQNMVEKPDLLILDAEGYEMNIINGANKLIESQHPDIIFELNPTTLKASGNTMQSLFIYLNKHGYKVSVIDEGNHSISFNNNVEIKLIDINSFDFSKISFVNVFATVK